jgi:hypothetical protein
MTIGVPKDLRRVPGVLLMAPSEQGAKRSWHEGSPFGALEREPPTVRVHSMRTGLCKAGGGVA